MSTDTSIKLTGPETWKAWNLRFINAAEENLLWDLIDPKSATRGAYKTRPVEPTVANYPKRLDTPDTPQGEGVDTSSQPANVAEMTSEGYLRYTEDVKAYNRRQKEWKEESQQMARLKAWLADHNNVAPTIYTAACKPGQKLHEWYDALKERAGVDKGQERQQAINKYNAATKPLTRKPKDMHAWLLNWQTAVEEAKEANLPGAIDSGTWWPIFATAVKNAGYQSWCESYRNSYRESIDSNELSVHKLVRDFRERLRDDDDVKANKVGKGAFVNWVDEAEKKDVARKDAPERTHRSARSPAPGGSRTRSRSPARRVGKRRYSNPCPACDRPHTLEECWAARPEIRPADRRPSKAAERLARERMEKDPVLRQLVEMFRKRVKVENDDTKAPAKGILKASDDTNEN